MDGSTLFLSYNSVDRPSVVAIQKLLAARGITAFLDRDQLVPGLPWPTALEDGLRGVRAVAVFIGRELGGWQKREMWFALDRQMNEEKHGLPFPVIPVLLPGADLTPSFLFSNTWIDLRSGFDSVAVAEPLEAFERTITASSPATAAVERAATLCPYRGLEAFREEHAAFFAGRTAFASELFKFTVGKELVVVVGPSGSGKSSVIQAGLVPRLRRELPPATTWDVITFTPGTDPFLRLASCLAPLLEPDLRETDRLTEAQKLGERLTCGDLRLESVIDRVIDKSNGTGRLLVVADQFEELFTLTPEPKRRPFAESIVRALGKAHFALLVTLRADFYSQIITLDRELSDRLASAQVNIGALTRDELRESITEPAKLVGLEFEPGLVDRILHDVGSEPGNLPLLEFALTGLWSKRQGRSLTNAAYNEIGGVTGALAQRAEEEYARLTRDEQTAARRLLSQLVRVARPEEGSEDTRQRIELPATDPLAEKVAQALAGPGVRLLVMGRAESEEQSGQKTVEVAHEALIRNWGRLRSWLNEDREFLLWRQRTQGQVDQWKRHECDASYLLRGVSLSESERWLVRRPQDLAPAEQQFVSDSMTRRERDREAERRRTRVLRGLFGLLLLGLTVASLVFYRLRQGAEFAARESTARELAAFSSEGLSEDPEKSVLLGMQAVNATLRFEQPPVPAAAEVLHQAILSSQVRLTLRGHAGAITGVTFSPDGSRLATASADKTVKVWDAVNGQELLTLRGHSDLVRAVAFSPDGSRLASASDDKTAKVWDAESGKELLTLRGHSEPVNGVAYSPDSKRLATVGFDGLVKVWDALSGQELLTFRGGYKGFVTGVVFSSDGKRLATGSIDKTATVWDAGSGKLLLILRGHSGTVNGLVFSRDGKRLATASDDKTAKVWDAVTGQELLSLRGHSDLVNGVSFSPDGERLATASSDETARVWNAVSGEQLLTLRGHTGEVDGVAFGPDGRRLVTASADTTAKVWQADEQELLTLHGHTDAGEGLAFSPDGNRLATANDDGTASVWDAINGRELLTLRGHSRQVRGVAFSSNGERLATASSDRSVKIWSAVSGEELRTLHGHRSAVYGIAFSPDGKRLATGSNDKTAKVWDATSGEPLLVLSGHSGWVQALAFSPDGKRLATASEDRTAKVWDAITGQDLLTLRGHSDQVVGVSFSPDGRRLATASVDGTAKVWDVFRGRELLALRGYSGVLFGVSFSPDGTRLATVSRDETAKVWNAVSGQELLSFRGHSRGARAVAFSPDGKRMATASINGTVQVYALDIRELLDLARKRVTRSLTPEECRRYLQSEACPPLP